MGDHIYIQTDVSLGPIKPTDVVVEVVYGNVGDHGLTNIMLMPLALMEELGDGVYRYETNLVLIQGTSGYTLRIRPIIQTSNIPLSYRW
ncbi:hypothetical protein N752_19200 [Desulforamulus aquiferis]|nr:hypothetical protein N752_19200 [Desulforamulus aquiferis]